VARAVLVAILALGLAAGCDNGPHPYAGPPEKNLRVLTVSTGGSVALEVHSCKGAYEGFVTLDRQAVEIGLPTGWPSLLVFEFRNPSVSNRKEVQVTPRAGYRYEARVALKEAIYDIELREINLSSGVNREIDAQRGC